MGDYLTMDQAYISNLFPVKGGVSQYFGPHVLLRRKPLDFEKHFSFCFGDYVEASDGRTPTNDNMPRTISAIYLRPSRTMQGGAQSDVPVNVSKNYKTQVHSDGDDQECDRFSRKKSVPRRHELQNKVL